MDRSKIKWLYGFVAHYYILYGDVVDAYNDCALRWRRDRKKIQRRKNKYDKIYTYTYAYTYSLDLRLVRRGDNRLKQEN